MPILSGHIVTAADIVDGIGRSVVKQTIETVTSNTTLQDDDELTLPVEANTNYIFDGYLIYSGLVSTTLGGFKFTFTGPTGATATWSAFGPNIAVTPPNDYDATANALGVTRSMGANGASAPMAAQPRGYLSVAGTAGSLLLRWAQHGSSATGTSVRPGSWLQLRKVV